MVINYGGNKLVVTGDLAVDNIKIEDNSLRSTSGSLFLLSNNNTIVAGNSDLVISNGNVGIGTNNANHKLSVNGSFSATTKSFRIKHPSKKEKYLEYGSLESPYHGIRLTGSGVLKNGECKINLPDYICDLVHEESVNIQITNIGHSKLIFVNKIDVKKNNFKVKANRCSTIKNLKFYWTFSAIRKDIPELVVETE